ncbi:MAG: type II toxin-antitoxin system VapC family toxin [Magnetococcales bacterium]|nr:type II toxin-antitoxin system VapC family toxin [Magnetococcales bacterium]NGZ07042.1 type II toxin-antitoxin system VapC family toxin [Magnetococcales bacterium]
MPWKFSACSSKENELPSLQTYLLDTNVLLIALVSPERLPQEVQSWLVNPDHDIYFSSASIWEIAIKCSLRREGFSFLPEEIHRLAIEAGFVELTLQSSHCYPVVNMPWHHRDPFDRILVAQSQSLSARLLTTDSMLSRYSDFVIVTPLEVVQ